MGADPGGSTQVTMGDHCFVISLQECLKRIIGTGNEILRSVQDNDWEAVTRLNSSRYELASMLSSVPPDSDLTHELQALIPEVRLQNERIQDVMAEITSRMRADLRKIKDGYSACLEYKHID